MLKVVIVDDEIRAIESLKWELSSFENDIHIVETFCNPEEAINFLKSNVIDCLFLDIQMPKMDGFQFLEKLPTKSFEVVITTAYSEYGIKALKNEALDYLLKPIDSDDLVKTIDKLKRVRKVKSENEGFETFEKMLHKFNDKLINKKIVLSTEGKLVFIDPADITYVGSEGNYCTIFFADGKKLVVVKKLKDVHALLPQDEFLRIHNSFVISMEKIKEFYKTDGYVLLEGNHKIPVSRQRRSEFLDKI